MRSTHNTVPVVTITASAGGWMVACSAGDFERWCVRRPGADRVAQDHRKTHAPREQDR